MKDDVPSLLNCPPPELWRLFERGCLDQPTLDLLACHLEQCQHCLQELEAGSTQCDRQAQTTDYSSFLLEPEYQRLRVQAGRLGFETSDAEEAEFAPEANKTEEITAQLGRYRVREILGTGGFGRVYLAEDPLLKRLVAIKVPQRGVFGTVGEKSDFLHEARNAAALDHPHIVPIFDVFDDDHGHVVIVMKYVDGTTLSSVISRGPLPLRHAVSLMAQIARAVDFAHEHGFVHRDLKPANILIDSQGQPHVTDFGLGLHVSETSAGRVTRGGTPAYMAPEQILHDVAQIGRRTDVWALGVILTELISQRRPFEDTTRAHRLGHVMHGAPVLPDDMDADLRGIVSGCLMSNVSERTESALKLAEQLEDWLQRGSAPPIRQRKPATALMSAALLVALVAVVLVWFSRDKAQQPVEPVEQTPTTASSLDEPVSAVPTVETSKEPPAPMQETPTPAIAPVLSPEQRLAQSKLYAIDMKQAFEASSTGQTELLQKLLEAQIPGTGQPDMRGFEWHFLRNSILPAHRTKSFPIWFGQVLCESPDGRHIAVGGMLAVLLLNARTLEIEGSLSPGYEEVRTLAYSPDGTLLAGIGHEGLLSVWRLPEKKPIISQKVFSETGWGLAFTPDNQRLVGSSGDGSIKVWRIDGSQLEELHSLKAAIQEGGNLTSLDLAPDGKVFATGSRFPDRVWFWSTETGQQVGEWNAPHAVSVVRFTRDGQRLMASVSGRNNYILSLKDLGQVSPTWESPYSKQTRDVDVSRDEQWLAIGGKDGEIQICQMGGGTKGATKTWQAHSSHLRSLRFLQDGHTLASTGDDNQLHLWDLRGSVCSERLKLPPVPDETRPRLAQLIPASWPIGANEPSPVLLMADDRGLHLRRSTTDEVLQTLVASTDLNGATIWACDLATGDRHRVAAHFSDGRLIWWDKVGDSEVTPTQHELPSAQVDCNLAVSPDGRWLALTDPKKPQLFDLDGAGPATALPEGNVYKQRFTPDSQRLLYISSYQLGAYDLATQSVLFEVPAHTIHVNALEVDAQGELIATSSHNHEIKLWDSRTGRLINSLPVGPAPVMSLTFSPDGRSLISAEENTSLRVWNIATGLQLGTLPSDRHWVLRLQFTTDGRHLLLRNNKHEYSLLRIP